MQHQHTKQKVLYVITKSNFGGAQRYVYDLATALQDDWGVVVALGGTGAQGAATGTLKARLDEAGVRTITIPHFMRDMSLLDDIRAFFELWRTVQSEQPDLLHVTSSKAGGLGALIGRLCRIRCIVFTSHGLTFDEVWRPMWQRALIYCFTWCTMLLSHVTIQISQDTFERARRMPWVGKKVRLVYNGIQAPDFLPRSEARNTLLPNTPAAIQHDVWIGSIAEYHPNKNLDVLIEAVVLLKQHGTIAHLVLIGEEGDGRAHLETIAQAHGVSDQVHLLGVVPNAAQYLKALDIFTLPSKKEGLPYVLLEAGLAELPVVVSNITGNTEIVTHEKTGLVTQATPKQLADALKTLINNPTLATQYGKALHEDVQRRFSKEQMVGSTAILYTPTTFKRSRKASRNDSSFSGST